MKIQVNGQPADVPKGLTVTELLLYLKVKMPDMVTVQVNGTILTRKDFPATPIRENDAVEFLYFMGGGVER